MSRQFQFFATAADLTLIERAIREAGDIDLLSEEPAPDLDALLPLKSLPIPPGQAGKVTLFCILAPRHLPPKMVIERVSAVKTSIDIQNSNLIEFWRPFHDGRRLGSGRLYFQNRVVINGIWVDKDPEFTSWADRTLARVKKCLKYDKGEAAWLGADAAALIASGQLRTDN